MTILQKICCYFLLAKLFLYLCPDEKYESYLSLLLEWTLVLLIVGSVAGAGRMGVSLERGELIWQEILAAVEEGKSQMSEEDMEKYIENSFDEAVVSQMQQKYSKQQNTEMEQ